MVSYLHSNNSYEKQKQHLGTQEQVLSQSWWRVKQQREERQEPGGDDNESTDLSYDDDDDKEDHDHDDNDDIVIHDNTNKKKDFNKTKQHDLDIAAAYFGMHPEEAAMLLQEYDTHMQDGDCCAWCTIL